MLRFMGHRPEKINPKPRHFSMPNPQTNPKKNNHTPQNVSGKQAKIRREWSKFVQLTSEWYWVVGGSVARSGKAQSGQRVWRCWACVLSGLLRSDPATERAGKTNKLNILWPKTAHLGPPLFDSNQNCPEKFMWVPFLSFFPGK